MISKATSNPLMQGYAVKFMQESSVYVARQLFPMFLTAEQSANYYVLGEENALNMPQNIQRGPGGAYSRSRMVLSDDSWNTREFGHEEPVDDRERKKYANALNADIAAIKRLSMILLFNLELRVKAKATSAAVPTATPATKWNRALAGDPVADVDAAKTAVFNGCGLEANTMVVSRDTWLELKEHPKVLAKIQYVDRGIVTVDILKSVFGVENFLVAGLLYNTAAEGAALSPGAVWGKSCVIAHVEHGQDLLAPNFGRVFGWTGEVGSDGVLIESYRQDEIRSDIHRARQDVDEKLVGAKAGYHLSQVLT